MRKEKYMDIKFRKIITFPVCLFFIGVGIAKLCYEAGKLDLRGFNICLYTFLAVAASMIPLNYVLFRVSALFDHIGDILSAFSFFLICFSGLFFVIAIVYNDSFFMLREIQRDDLNLLWMIFGLNITMYVLWFNYWLKTQLNENSNDFDQNCMIYAQAHSIVLLNIAAVILSVLVTLLLNSMNPKYFEIRQHLSIVAFAVNIYCCIAMLVVIVYPLIQKTMAFFDRSRGGRKV